MVRYTISSDGHPQLKAQCVTRRRFQWMTVAAIASGGACFAAPRANAAGATQTIPRLRIVIPANEGGGWDQTGRALGAAMVASGAISEVTYENVGGKGGTIGLTRYVEKYAADADTLLMGGMVMVGAVALQRPAVTLANITPVARLTSDYEVVVVRADSPVRTPKDLVAKLRADPAAVPIAGGSAGGVDHIFAGMLARVAGKTNELVYQPNPGGAEVVAAVISGKAQVGISGFSEFSAAVSEGKLRAIGVSSKRPFNGISSMREQGVDADLANWRGVFTGKEVSAQRKAVLLEAVRRGTQHDSWLTTIKRNNWDNGWMTGKDFDSFLELDQAMAGVMVQLLKLKS